MANPDYIEGLSCIFEIRIIMTYEKSTEKYLELKVLKTSFLNYFSVEKMAEKTV